MINHHILGFIYVLRKVDQNLIMTNLVRILVESITIVNHYANV
jgi:hypothetical protein